MISPFRFLRSLSGLGLRRQWRRRVGFVSSASGLAAAEFLETRTLLSAGAILADVTNPLLLSDADNNNGTTAADVLTGAQNLGTLTSTDDFRPVVVNASLNEAGTSPGPTRTLGSVR